MFNWSKEAEYRIRRDTSEAEFVVEARNPRSFSWRLVGWGFQDLEAAGEYLESVKKHRVVV